MPNTGCALQASPLCYFLCITHTLAPPSTLSLQHKLCVTSAVMCQLTQKPHLQHEQEHLLNWACCGPDGNLKHYQHVTECLSEPQRSTQCMLHNVGCSLAREAGMHVSAQGPSLVGACYAGMQVSDRSYRSPPLRQGCKPNQRSNFKGSSLQIHSRGLLLVFVRPGLSLGDHARHHDQRTELQSQQNVDSDGLGFLMLGRNALREAHRVSGLHAQHARWLQKAC